ncbi:plasma membrane-associated cation-binding protein 1-like [Canna indica]|uniref:Plasma membrane-associated cation-binding protein 1-like n=1 Tax=Canna indica TaxID=4628 RepID=A0AAQ3Q9D8_9LILI|nr:plasma membrane-associated cation-binding protein 1-like [Canna indica]
MASSYSWKLPKLLPTIKRVFDRNGHKAAAAEACKLFNESKEEIAKEIEDNKTDLQPKLVEILENCTADIKALVKKPTEPEIKKKSVHVVKFMEELAKIEFPGSKPVSEAASKYGSGLVAFPIIFILEKVSTLVSDKPPEPAAVADGDATKEEEAEKAGETPASATVSEEGPTATRAPSPTEPTALSESAPKTPEPALKTSEPAETTPEAGLKN